MRGNTLKKLITLSYSSNDAELKRNVEEAYFHPKYTLIAVTSTVSSDRFAQPRHHYHFEVDCD